ncbi:LysR family transcriptional regulator [Phaeobacter italicus]|uniref:LysR family transcriptional regulator n=1 Tax=Phaeobacter italicus TaxID=481446 RepID=UPI001C9577D9|nr:LysR family transcriptional regulator [Phaeobacter italicus]MBY6044719.1 LysR family transcriptional regulator [Phaeobacter italicus]
MNFATLDLNLLRVLDAVFAEGSTVKAGRRLGLSQSAVSGALSRLRHALNDPLFVRQGNQLVATEFAESLRHDLRAELDRLETLLSPPSHFDPATASGLFRISAADFFCDMLMPRLGDLLSRKAPGIRAQLLDLVPRHHVESLERQQADLALLPDTDLPDWMMREPLFRSEYAVLARRGNPATKDLRHGERMPFDLFCSLPHVLFAPHGDLTAQSDEALAKVGRRRRVVMTVPVFSGVCRVVSESDLIGLLPLQLARKVQPVYGLDLFVPPIAIDPIQLIGVWHRKADTAPMAAWMRQQIFDILRPLDRIDLRGLANEANP